jgi:1-acyl-sn-glycerol-3-phosphate acyltransferase
LSKSASIKYSFVVASEVDRSDRKRKSFKYPSPLAMSLLRAFAFISSKLFWSIKFRGIENIPDRRIGGIVVVSNHSTYFDPAWISLKLKWPLRYMAWDAVFEWRFIGPAIRHFGAFPVKLRSGPAKSTIVEALRSLRNGAALVIFPEGEREFADGKLHDFKSGAVHIALNAGVPILPVSIRGGDRIWPQGQKYPKFFRHVEVIYHPIVVLNETPKDADLDAYLEMMTSQLKKIIEAAV